MNYSSHEQWEPGTYTEEDFSNLVMLGSETMLPNKRARIHLHALETPIRAAHQYRRMGISNLDINAPSDLNFRYSETEETFCVSALSLCMENGRKMSLRKEDEYYLAQNGDSFDASLIERALFEYELPSYTPPEDAAAYKYWLQSLVLPARSWRIQEQSPIRANTVPSKNLQLHAMGSLSARLINIRETIQHVRGDAYQRAGVEYTISDRTPDSSRTSPVIRQISFVGEEADTNGIEFKSYDQTVEYNPKTRRTKNYERREVLLTPLHQKIWIDRLVDQATGIPYAGPTLK